MAAYVACNAKYYKASQWKGLAGHVHRQFEHDENVVTHLSHENFGCQFADLPTLERRMMEAKQAAGLRARGFQADANVVLDNVLILSAQRVEELKAAYPYGYKQRILDAAVRLSERIRDAYGLEPMGIEFHWDEGHEGDDGVFKHNYHAHMQFFNFNFKELNQPLRRMKRDDFSKIQDLAGECYSHLGFERGESKKASKNKHLEKKNHIKKKLESAITVSKGQYEQIGKITASAGEAAMKIMEQKKELEKELNNLKNNKLSLEQQIKDLNQHFEQLKSKVVPMASMGRMLETHRSDFERFLTLSPSDGIAERLKVAEKRLQELEGGFKTPVDEYLNNYDAIPELKRF